jgi:tetrapyrrole methylase family protein/MazG family protein
MTMITLLGLGVHSLTNDARAQLAAAQHVCVLTRAHPAIRHIPSHLAVHSLDEELARTNDWNMLPHTIAAALVDRAADGTDLTVAVPGHPLVGNLVVQHVRKLARQQAIEVRVVAGMSGVDEVCALVDGEESGGLQVLDALALLQYPHFPHAADDGQRAWSELQGVGPYTPPVVPFPLQPTQPALLCNPDRRMVPVLLERLRERYPQAHMAYVVSVHDAGLHLETAALEQLASRVSDQMVALYLPPLAVYDDVHAEQALNWVTARLLGPAGCPWDREQTHQSLRRYLLEETHETLEALDAEDWDGLSEELGDLLLQIVLHSEMARQAGHFAWGDVTAQVTQKLIRRHPHVFGELAVSGSGEVLRNWDAIKAQERAAKGTTRKSLLDGVPVSLPALAAAQHIGERVAKVGFDWPNVDGVWAKVVEELDEIRAASTGQRSEEFGDLLFVLARLGSWLGVDMEAALREANAKFRRRFAVCERLANGRELKNMTPAELDALWNAAKGEERQGA